MSSPLSQPTLSPSVVQPLGLFEDHADVGPVRLPGSCTYDAARQEYRITGAGTNMWLAYDEFHLTYRRMTGDFILSARCRFLGDGVDLHRKLGWIVRAALTPDAAYVSAAVHGGDGLTSLQFRRTPGALTDEVRSPLVGPDMIQLERKGETYTMSVAHFGQEFSSVSVADIAGLGDTVYVGLFVTSHNADVVEEAVFTNVRVTVPSPETLVPYREYLGSCLEMLDVESGQREAIYTETGCFEAPNWTPDGAALIYNRAGGLYRFPLDTRTPERIDTGDAEGLNNDHVLSFDGTQIGISYRSPDPGQGGKSIISVLPVGGGTPRRVTPLAPSYLHGWSPDGETLLYTAERGDGNYDIYSIPTQGGTETRLTTAPGLDDGSEYTPDGNFIYFNSERSGRMQIWRMRPDGSAQEQVTDDKFNNWFPHVSPDGKQIAFLSYNGDIPSNQHPYYKPVYLRLINIEGGTPKVIAYTYGGQGTINVPSWSPDSKKLAFVSNSGPLPEIV
ncbi:MAG: TolB family protein [Akkermansiaceae bacterium]|nr:TolB family protein [Armatimonadota bacterium]